MTGICLPSFHKLSFDWYVKVFCILLLHFFLSQFTSCSFISTLFIHFFCAEEEQVFTWQRGFWANFSDKIKTSKQTKSEKKKRKREKHILFVVSIYNWFSGQFFFSFGRSFIFALIWQGRSWKIICENRNFHLKNSKLHQQMSETTKFIFVQFHLVFSPPFRSFVCDGNSAFTHPAMLESTAMTSAKMNFHLI